MFNYLSHKKSDHLTQKSESDDSFVFSIYIYDNISSYKA